MEELVGKVWHRFIYRAASRQYPEARVTLEEVKVAVGVMFRALAGDGTLGVETATRSENTARRGWLQRIAGAGRSVELAWREVDALRLPSQLAVFPRRRLNRDLYLWLAALAAAEATMDSDGEPWLLHNQRLTREVLDLFPGMGPRYARLLEAQLVRRPDPEHLRRGERAWELAIRQALSEPGSVDAVPPFALSPQPVFLWLHPSPPLMPASRSGSDDVEPQTGEGEEGDGRKRRGEQIDHERKGDGLITLRMENILTWSDFVNVDRTEEEDTSEARTAAEDMDVMSISRKRGALASRLRFDLDLPHAAHDDLPIGEGISLPEWDYRRRSLRPAYCLLQPMLARDATPCSLPPHLTRHAARVRRQLESLVLQRNWLNAQSDGSEIDLNAYLDFATARRHGNVAAPQGLYRDFRNNQRDMACLLLADLSLSTDAAVNNQARVIDVIRESLYLFAEGLGAVGDRFAIYGFSSRRRQHVRCHTIKSFDEPYDAQTRGRIGAIRPGYYTRMGAALRYASGLLAAQGASRRLLLLLTDGKPNDLDHYEGRYGVEDTRHAIFEARRQGLSPFCVTIDRRAGDYLPHLFGPGNYLVIRRPDELPARLPLLYARLSV